MQTRHCLEQLAATLKAAGSSLERVLKADVHLADAADYYEFKRVWREYFPKNPPARTTVEVGDTLPFSGTRLSLDAVALANDLKLQAQVLNDPESNDALEAEWASHAVRAGNWVFCSAFPATDFKTGIAVGKRPGFPNYGNDAEMQARRCSTHDLWAHASRDVVDTHRRIATLRARSQHVPDDRPDMEAVYSGDTRPGRIHRP